MKVGKKQQPRYLPRVRSVRDEIRKIYKENDILEALPPIRNTPTRLERVLTSRGIAASLANVMTVEEGLEFIAAESGLAFGQTSHTVPELIVFTYLKKAGYTYGGEGPSYNPNADFSYQVPINGGKFRKGGTDSDFFASPKASGTFKGTLIFIDGSYSHSQNAIATRDKAAELTLTAQGWKVERIRDVEVYQGGVLDNRLKQIFLPK